VNPIVNVQHFWRCVTNEALSLLATAGQQWSIMYLETISGTSARMIPESAFVELEVKMIEGILSIRATECDDRLQPVINGVFMQLAIEEDGYIVLTSSKNPKPVTFQPPRPAVTT